MRKASSTDARSPFAEALGGIDDLPKQFADQFLLNAGCNEAVLVEGTMSRVWHRPFWIVPGLWLLSRLDMLFPDTGENVPVVMKITAFARAGRTIQVWDRSFTFPRQRRFIADVSYDPNIQAITERFGIGGRLELQWRVRFKAPDTVSIRGSKWALRLGPLRLPIPSLLVGSARASQRALPGTDDTIQMELSVHNRLIGTFFGYEGRFTVRRVPQP